MWVSFEFCMQAPEGSTETTATPPAKGVTASSEQIARAHGAV